MRPAVSSRNYRPRVTPDQRHQARDWRAQGHIIAEIAAWLDLPDETVRYHVKDIPHPSGKSWPRGGHKRRYDWPKIERLIASGVSATTVAHRLGIKPASLHAARCRRRKLAAQSAPSPLLIAAE